MSHWIFLKFCMNQSTREELSREGTQALIRTQKFLVAMDKKTIPDISETAKSGIEEESMDIKEETKTDHVYYCLTMSTTATRGQSTQVFILLWLVMNL